MTNDKDQRTNQVQNPNDKKRYDLEERTAEFGEAIIGFAKTLPRDIINSQLISQIVRAATSIGANYMEADGAESKKDFHHRISICKRESKEAKHWLRMIVKANPHSRDEYQRLSREAQELTLIFSAILVSKKR
jgi:four helix bundle protein